LDEKQKSGKFGPDGLAIRAESHQRNSFRSAPARYRFGTRCIVLSVQIVHGPGHIGNDGRSETHRHLNPLGWGPKGRWFKSSRPDYTKPPLTRGFCACWDGVSGPVDTPSVSLRVPMGFYFCPERAGAPRGAGLCSPIQRRNASGWGYSIDAEMSGPSSDCVSPKRNASPASGPMNTRNSRHGVPQRHLFEPIRVPTSGDYGQ
jgi:hypothetical protein